MREPHGPSEGVIWRPRWVWRRAALCGVFLLALTPMAAGVWIIWSAAEHSLFPMALIAFGPITVAGVFAVMMPSLDGPSIRRRRHEGEWFSEDREEA